MTATLLRLLSIIGLERPAQLIKKFSWLGVFVSTITLASGFNLLGKNNDEPNFLPPEQAFQLETAWADKQTLTVRYTIAKGYYLYRERFAFSVTQNGQALQDEVAADLPKGVIHFDENLQKSVETYRDSLRLTLRLSALLPPGAAITLTSQGCADAGLCYPPQTSVIPWQAPAQKNAEAPAEALQDESQSLQNLLSTRSVWLALPIFFGLGLLLAFTPCVLPILPILSSIIAGREVVGTKAHPKPWRGLQLAALYSLGMALVYTALGVAAGLAGQGLAQALQTPTALLLFASVLVVLALSKFGWYELQLPAFIRHRLHGQLESQQGGQAVGVLIMGALSGLMVGPCVAPPLAGALLYISQSGDPVRGGAALFALACGMSVPLLLLGASAGHWLPKAGAWMNQIKQVFGLLLLAVALWIVQPISPSWVWPLGLGLLLLGVAVVLRAWQKLPPHAGGKAQFFQWLGLVAGLLGCLQVIGVASGGRDALQPLAHLQGASNAQSQTKAHSALPFVRVKNLAELEQALKNLPPEKTWAMLDFYADWCVACKEMERFTLSQASVQQALQDALWLQVDVTANTPEDQALLKRFNLFGPPGIVFFNARGEEVPGARVIGFQNTEKFTAQLAAVRRTLK